MLSQENMTYTRGSPRFQLTVFKFLRFDEKWKHFEMISLTHLHSASLQLSLVIECLILLLGTIENILNVLICMSRKPTFQKSPCSHYFVIITIMNNLQMLHGLSHRILSSGFSIDATLTSLVYCKRRQCLIMSVLFMRHTLSYIATISQFFSNSLQVSYR